MSRELSLETRASLLLGAQAEDPYRKIVKNAASKDHKNISTGTVTKTLNRYEETGTLLDKPRSGRPPVFDPMEEEAIVKAVEKDPKLTAVDIYKDPILNEANASLRKIQYLLKDNGLQATTTRPKLLKPKHISQRLAFANEYVKKPEFWPRVVFSDECDLFPYKSGKLFIRRRKGEYPLSYYNMSTRWDKRTVKVWGCISSEGVGPIVRYDETMDHTKLLRIYEDFLIEEYPKLRGTSTRPGPLLFQQDGAGCHRDGNVKNWFEECKIWTLNWPSYSPDLNPLENIWGILQDKLYEYNDTLETSDDVWEKSYEIWENDINQYIENLYKSMPDRMEEVIQRAGGRLDR